MNHAEPTPDAAAELAARLERQVRMLERKLRRSEESRAQLEAVKDRFDTLYNNLLSDLSEQKALVEEKNATLEALSPSSPSISRRRSTSRSSPAARRRRSRPSARSSPSSSATSRTSRERPKICRPRTSPSS
jgi:peptidoglycan hydrolase CwlO-like protein